MDAQGIHRGMRVLDIGCPLTQEMSKSQENNDEQPRY